MAYHRCNSFSGFCIYIYMCIYMLGLVCCGQSLHIRVDSLPIRREQQPDIDPSLQAVMPIEFVHVPKCGTSFLNTLIHLPGACPALPENLELNEETMGEMILHNFFQRYRPDLVCNSSVLDYQTDAHLGVEAFPGGFDGGKGRFMIFVRQPEQRLLSGYHFVRQRGQGSTLEELEEASSGIVTRMLTAKEDAHGPHPTRAQVDEAKSRLQSGFSFIGITDEWDLSICLFNKMFNQACSFIQFSNSRATHAKSTSSWDTAELNGWRDPYDNEVFDVALQLFQANLKKYNVSESSCQPCYREARLLD